MYVENIPWPGEYYKKHTIVVLVQKNLNAHDTAEHDGYCVETQIDTIPLNDNVSDSDVSDGSEMSLD